jgi:hypothetical protein
MNCHRLFLLFLSFFCILFTKGQFASRKLEVGLDAGVFVYQGDVAPSVAGSWKTIQPGLALSKLQVFRDASNINPTYFAEGSDVYTGLVQDFAHPTPPLLFCLPLGLGLRFALNERWGLKMESNDRFTFTDYLDGFSKSANSSLKDSYHSATLGFF